MEKPKLDQIEKNSHLNLLTSICFRAISDDKDAKLTINLSNNETPRLNENHLVIPIISNELSDNDINIIRGISDSTALKLKYHNKDIHLKYLPSNETESIIYNVAETIRYESLGINNLKGIEKNIHKKI